ncbi:white-brown complex homolog 30 [Paramuricea clavata]|uniref:White-brown complex homolog 30 n=1 Tax=Paramuricea clavata TaxID=317549 RepID=A0A6S7JRX8_PARCT|nr:white-brown complex homolog 30 [Paramuricea clavata]
MTSSSFCFSLQTMGHLGIRTVANTQIGDEETRGISGGQRRRVNIGMELVADPTILFLDEPTTGLDSSSSLAVVKALNTVAAKTNMTICCVIHQPRFEILKMFDKVLFLGQGGRTVYSGPVDGAETYFAKIGYPLPPYVNPADFYMDVISGSVKNERNVYTSLFEEWEKHQMMVEEVGSEVGEPNEVGAMEEGGDKSQNIQSNGSRSTIEIDRPSSQIHINMKEAGRISDSSQDNETVQVTPSPIPSSIESCEEERVLEKPKVVRLGFFSQLWVFFRREVVLQLRMSRTLLLDQVLTMIAGAVLGLLFREVYIYDVHETTVLGNIISGLGAVVAATRRFGQNRVVFWRESASGINRVSYFFAVNLAYIPVLLISPAVYLSIYYSIAAFLAPFYLHYAVFLCGWYCLSGLGYVMSLMMTPRNSQMAAIVTVVIMALLSGGSPELCKLDDTFIATAFYNLSFSRWIAEAIFEIEAAENSQVLNDIISRVQIDNHYDLQSYRICIGALLALGTGYRLIALLLLLFTKRGQQK